MKNTPLHHGRIIAASARGMFLAMALAFTGSFTPLATAEDYEWDPDWGLHDEEWYDPSDWFSNDDTVSVEEVGNMGYDDPYYADSFWYDYSYYPTYGYTNATYGPGTTSYYQWNPSAKSWEQADATQEASNKARETARSQSANQKPKQAISKEDVVTMRGTVTNVATAKTKGTDKKHTFARLQVDDKRNVLVDFGPETEAKAAKIKKGQQIQVTGPRAKFGGRYILVAQQVGQISSEARK